MEWEYGKIVEVDDGTWWIALYHRDGSASPWKPCWRSVVNHARYDPFSAFERRTGVIRGFARTNLDSSAFANEVV
jgi:hypothetical protein